MTKVDCNKLNTALIYVERITEGHNPFNNIPVDTDSVINNPNVIRCMFFIKDVLEEIKRNDGHIGRRPRSNRDNTKSNYPFEVLEHFEYTGEKTITKLIDQLNSLADMAIYKKLSYSPVRNWLKENGYLMEQLDNATYKKSTVPTNKGFQLGIKSEIRTNSIGVEYICTTYGKEAQEFIVANIKSIFTRTLQI